MVTLPEVVLQEIKRFQALSKIHEPYIYRDALALQLQHEN